MLLVGWRLYGGSGPRPEPDCRLSRSSGLAAEVAADVEVEAVLQVDLAPTAWRRRADQGGLEARQSIPAHLA
jgi:hypothetical protein